MAEWRALSGDEQAVLLEGLRSEFGKKEWNEALDDVVGGPEFAPQPDAVRDDSLSSLAEMGFTVKEER